MPARCVITGMDLWVESSNQGIHGDLFDFDDMWVVNGVVCRTEADWYYDKNQAGVSPFILHVPNASSYFERRGMVLVPKGLAYLNDAAYHYVFGEERPR